jgi:hypothetical protein
MSDLAVIQINSTVKVSSCHLDIVSRSNKVTLLFRIPLSYRLAVATQPKRRMSMVLVRHSNGTRLPLEKLRSLSLPSLRYIAH